MTGQLELPGQPDGEGAHRTPLLRSKLYRCHTRHSTRVKSFHSGSFARGAVLARVKKNSTRINSPLVRRWVNFLTRVILLLTRVKCLVWPLYRVRPGLNLKRIILSSCERYSGSDSRYNNPVHVSWYTATYCMLLY